VRHERELVHGRFETVLAAQLQEVDRAVVHALSRVERRVAVRDVAAVAVEGEEHTRLLEALPDRSDAVRVIDVLTVALLDSTAGNTYMPLPNTAPSVLRIMKTWIPDRLEARLLVAASRISITVAAGFTGTGASEAVAVTAAPYRRRRSRSKVAACSSGWTSR
jgi:hypothetical protein